MVLNGSRRVSSWHPTNHAPVPRVADNGNAPGRGAEQTGCSVADPLVTAKAEAIDPQQRTVTLRGPQGNAVTLQGGEQVKQCDQGQVGDEVVVRHTEAVVIAVQKS